MSRTYQYRGLSALVAIVCLIGCEAAKSANPTAPSVAGPIPGVSITAPKPLEPGAGATLVAQSDPYTLLIENPGTSGQRTIWLQLEIAADANFQQVVHQADRIEPGPNGRTAYRLPEPLGAGFTYYWRSRAADGANTGPYSAVSNFTVVVPVVIEAPVAVEPSGNLTTNKPTFKARNGAISGTAGVVYRFEVSNNADMNPAMAVVTAAPGGNGDTTMSLGELPYNTVLYWRIYGTDGSMQSGYSQTLSFKTGPAPVVYRLLVAAAACPAACPRALADARPIRLAADCLSRTCFRSFRRWRRPTPARSRTLVRIAAATGSSWTRSSIPCGPYDTRWGYNGKRGNVNDPSKDVVDYHYGAGPDANSTDVYIIDVIGGHCGSSPTANWGDVTDVTVNSGTIGRWTSRGRF